MDKSLVVSEIAELRSQIATWRKEGQRIAFVPTMGYLHEGHLSLMRQARTLCDRLVVSIFVNPTQFGPNEDLSQYPRDFDGDLAKIRSVGGDLVFFPSNEAIYPPGAQTFVEVTELTQVLCGVSRPVHFRGVTTVVSKLFLIVQPDVAIFGEKDFQQLVTIQRMTKDLHFPIEVLGGSIVRESDGLAMSSRNAYLDPDLRMAARCLSRALREVRARFEAGERDAKVLRDAAYEIVSSTSGAEVDYVDLREPSTLQIVEGEAKETDRLFLAAYLGRARLIDNAPLGGACGL
ncbi:MAG: pantoate--beta-alanine ligase [Myxococcales bacterium]|nr:pantoate--beta-alanine ligase [Myxococcales bacterium]